MSFGKIVDMPDGHKSLVLDKSAFQSLSRAEHARATFGFTTNVTPVLLREILTDLTKQDPNLGLRPDECVQLLARKFLGSGGVINVDSRKLCVHDLLGASVSGDGRVLIEDFSYVTDPSDPDGPPAVWIEPGRGNLDILRWAQAEFTDRERQLAAGLRERGQAFSLEQLRGRLRAHHVLLPRPKNTMDLGTVANEILVNNALQRALVDWLVDQCGAPTLLRREVLLRWEFAQRPPLAKFAPYAHHCARVLLMLLLGMTHRLLSDPPTNRIDAEYLFYSPFCHVFVSSDKLHKQLAPAVMWPGQRFVTTDEFRKELSRATPDAGAGVPELP